MMEVIKPIKSSECQACLEDGPSEIIYKDADTGVIQHANISREAHHRLENELFGEIEASHQQLATLMDENKALQVKIDELQEEEHVSERD